MRFANVGTLDRMIRILLGAAFIALPFLREEILLSSATGIAATAVGVILILTAIVQFCPIYGILGLRTRRKSS